MTIVKKSNTEFNDNSKNLLNKEYNKNADMLCYTKDEFDYSKFYELFGLYLSKMPNNSMTKQVNNVYNRKGIFCGLALKKTNIQHHSRLLIVDGKLQGVVLNTQQLGIELNGETNNIDDCVYSTYFSMVRSAIICNENTILTDYNFHAVVISYFYYTILKTFGRINILTKKKLDGILLACAYLYLRQHLLMNHSSAKNRAYKIFNKIDKSTFDEYSPKFELLTKYKSLKDIGKVLIDLDIISEDPNRILISLIKLIGKTHFYNLMGPLSYIVGSIVLSNYPSNLFDKNITINTNIQNKIETLTLKYLSKIKYEIDILSTHIWG